MILSKLANLKVTLFATTIICLSTALGANSKPLPNQNKTIIRADQLSPEPQTASQFNVNLSISRSTSLVDFQDGSRSDGMDYSITPSYSTKWGQVSTSFIYSQDLKDSENITNGANDWSDLILNYSLPSTDWEWSPPYVLYLTPRFYVALPLSKLSLKRDELTTAIGTGFTFGIKPDGLNTQKDGAWNLSLSISAGKNFHEYSEDINGNVLNSYSSNQILNLGYGYKDWNFSFEFTNKSRWTYQGNTKQAFIATQEIGYSINNYFSLALGHTNGGSPLKANGFDSNIELINENSSSVYVTVGASF